MRQSKAAWGVTAALLAGTSLDLNSEHVPEKQHQAAQAFVFTNCVFNMDFVVNPPGK